MIDNVDALPITDADTKKPGYRIIECIDCGKRKKAFNGGWQCEECYTRVESRKAAIRKRLLKENNAKRNGRRRRSRRLGGAK